jgi:hypothetical protein
MNYDLYVFKHDARQQIGQSAGGAPKLGERPPLIRSKRRSARMPTQARGPFRSQMLYPVELRAPVKGG